MKKRNIIIVLVLIVLTAIVASIYLSGRPATPGGNITVFYEGKELSVMPFKADTVSLQGTVINGNGQQKEINSSGVSVQSALKLAGISPDDFSSARVVASDEYSASLSASEIASDATAFLIAASDDTGKAKINLVVFGDTDAKRQVKDVVRIELEK